MSCAVDLCGYQTLAFTREGAILTAALNRPEVMNAINAQSASRISLGIDGVALAAIPLI